jgi:hypothetical protein
MFCSVPTVEDASLTTLASSASRHNVVLGSFLSSPL